MRFKMDRMEILKTAYEILDHVTPLRTDCGKLCNQVCCQDNDGVEEETGMLLFPGEEELYADCSDWMTLLPVPDIRPDQILARCEGSCPREQRPLACRVFPLTPYLTENDILLIKMDARASSLCPLAGAMDKNRLAPEFIKAVRKASALLITDPSIKEYIRDLSRMLDEYTSLMPHFYNTLNGKYESPKG